MCIGTTAIVHYRPLPIVGLNGSYVGEGEENFRQCVQYIFDHDADGLNTFLEVIGDVSFINKVHFLNTAMRGGYSFEHDITFMQCACRALSPKCMKVLIDKGAKVEANKSPTPNGFYSFTEYTVESFVSAMERDQMIHQDDVLQFTYRFKLCVELLISKGDVNETNLREFIGAGLQSKKIHERCPEICRYLLELLNSELEESNEEE